MSSLLQICERFGGPPDRAEIFCLQYEPVVFWEMAYFQERCLILRDTHPWVCEAKTIRGHPLKGAGQEEKLPPCKKTGFSCRSQQPATPPTIPAVSLVLESALAAPVTHQDQGRFRVPVGKRPFPPEAGQKIFGSMPCPNYCSALMVVNHPLTGSWHGQQSC